MGLFGNDLPKRVTEVEFKEIMSRLYGKLDENERVEVEKLFRADLYESGREAGITQEEFGAGITWLKNNPRKHILEETDIELITKYFEEHLKD
ncbi:hypothetical protein KC902_03190 [Candidatus Kaiserbacteria bacterium]|nr:hypothetical protein [Candidatus Kaiserbacteria bacterium]USN88450.1 MAG: hypothetical protein H6780_03065 [Candidatus Nomurabacteria bacterium]